MTHPGDSDAMLRMNGAGENLIWSAADFENFLKPRPDLKPIMEPELEKVVRSLVDKKKILFRIQAIHPTTVMSVYQFLDAMAGPGKQDAAVLSSGIKPTRPIEL